MELDLTNLNVLLEIIHESIQKHKSLGLYSMVAISFVLYSHGYNFTNRSVKKFVMDDDIPTVNQLRLTDAIWRLLFCTGVILFSLVSIWSVKDGNITLALLQAVTIPQCNTTLFRQNGNVLPEIVTLIAPLSYFFHQLYISASSIIYDGPSFFSISGLALFVISANFAKCPPIIQFLLLFSLNVGTLEFARALFALKSRCRGYRGPPASILLQTMAVSSFILHILVWLAVNFYMLPTLYLALPSVREKDLPCPPATAYINIFLILFAQQQLFQSPVWSMFKLAVRRPSSKSSLKSLAAVVLLPYTGTLLSELRAIQMNFLLDSLPTSAERRMIRKKILSSGMQTSAPISEGKADLLSIVKCVKILKKKMQNRYELKNARETSVQERGGNAEDTRNQSDIVVSTSPPENQDITDIYIPVPSPLSGAISNENMLEEESLQEELGGPVTLQNPNFNENHETPSDNANNPDDSQRFEDSQEN